MKTIVVLLFIVCSLTIQSANATRHVVNQVSKTFIGPTSDDKLKEALDDSLGTKARALKLEKLVIKAGDEIEFVNADSVTHNVYSDDFDLKTQAVKQKDVVPFNKKGKYQIRCGIHPKMKLDLEVQ